MADLLFGRDGRLRSGWKILLFGLGAAVANGLAGTLRASLAPDCRWLPGPCWSGLALLALTGWCLGQEGRPLASVGLALDRRWALQWLAGVLSGAGLIGLMALASFLGGGFDLVRHPAVGPGALLAGAWLYLAVAVGEELLFRGYAFQHLIQGLATGPALLLMALLFAASHGGNPGMTGATRIWAGLNLFLAGLLLGLAYVRTGSLALPMGLHLGWNWTQGSLLGFGVSGLHAGGWWSPVFHHGQPLWLTGGRFGLEASLPCTLLGALACAVLTWRPSGKNLPGWINS
jgi:membrane protease YdiL (CAAX protease family)